MEPRLARVPHEAGRGRQAPALLFCFFHDGGILGPRGLECVRGERRDLIFRHDHCLCDWWRSHGKKFFDVLALGRGSVGRGV
jgi:hypothetical protein